MAIATKSFRLRLIFIGLTLEEKTSIEIAFSRYSVFYSRDIEKVANISSFDVIISDEETYYSQQKFLLSLNKPLFTVGSKKVEGSQDNLKRPMIVHEWLKAIEAVAKPVRKPIVSPIRIGSIVRSKTTPMFGKGIVISLEGDNEAIVKFPLNKMLPPGKPLRCHLSQLQLLGNIEDSSPIENQKKVTK
jgi:hypothetical protein